MFHAVHVESDHDARVVRSSTMMLRNGRANAFGAATVRLVHPRCLTKVGLTKFYRKLHILYCGERSIGAINLPKSPTRILVMAYRDEEDDDIIFAYSSRFRRIIRNIGTNRSGLA